MKKKNIFLTCILLLSSLCAYAESPQKMRWISISSDSKDIVHEIIRSEVNNQEYFTALHEDRSNQKAVEREKEIEDLEYKSSIDAASKEFARAKKKRDDITSQFNESYTELEESAKGKKTVRATIENLESQISRYEQDKALQSESLKKWLKTEKQGEVLVAVLYTRGFKDSVHELESAADKASAPLIAQHMGTYIQSFTEVINNVVNIDYIRATEQGTCKWNNNEPLRFELTKTERGTTYLRLKRYELYPFQEKSAGKPNSIAASASLNVAIVDSRQILDSFLSRYGFNFNFVESGRIDALIKDTALSNAAAEVELREQINTFQDRITVLQKKVAGAKEEAESQKSLLRKKEDTYYKMSLDVAAIRERKESAERQFQEAQTALNQKKRSHESIIIKTAVANAKGSQTPAEASAEAILDKLAEVKNDAKTQHSTSTTVVIDSRLAEDSAVQSITEARITAVRLISFVNEGEQGVRVKMAFRVKTELQPEQQRLEPAKPELALPATEALGCVFTMRSVRFSEDGLHLLLDVMNANVEKRKVAFYDDSWPSWPGTKISDENGQYHETTKAYVLQNGKKALMVDIDRNGRGIEIQPQNTVTMELVLKSVPVDAKTLKINLHPFIYYQSDGSEKWEEFDLPMDYNLSKTAATPLDEVRGKLKEISGGESDKTTSLQVVESGKKIADTKNPALASKEALGCTFIVRSVGLADDGLHLLLEVMNKNVETRKVAFYDDSFGSWTKTRISDESGTYHDTTKAYVVRDGQKTLIIDMDRKGRIEILPQNSAIMELVFQTLSAPTRKIKIDLHPFIYYKSGWREKWEEFSLPVDFDMPKKPVQSKVSPKKRSR